MKKALKYFLIILGLSFQKPLFPQDLVLKIGDPAPELNFYELGTPEKMVSWQDYENQIIILDFWATWCPPCIEAIPHLNKLVEEFEDRPVKFISITYEPPHMLTSFLKKHPMKSTVAIDNDFAMFTSYKAWGIPMIAVIDRNQTIASMIHPTQLTAAVIEDALAGEPLTVEQAKGWPDPEGAEEYFRSLVKKAEEKSE